MKKVFLLLAIFSMQAIHVSADKIETEYRNALVLAYSQANSVYEDDNIKGNDIPVDSNTFPCINIH